MTKTLNDSAAPSTSLPPLPPVRRRWLPPLWLFVAAGLVFLLCYPAVLIGRSMMMAVYLREADDAYNAGDLNGAADYFSSAMGLSSANEEPYSKRWQIALQTGDLESALGDFASAVDDHPSASLPYCYRGQAYRELELYEQAIPDYEACINNTPNNVWRSLAPSALQNVKKKLGE